MQEVLGQLKVEGCTIDDADIGRLSPLIWRQSTSSVGTIFLPEVVAMGWFQNSVQSEFRVGF